MPVIKINGKTYRSDEGSDLSFYNGVVTVNGKVIESGLSGNVDITWDGPLANLKTDGSVTCGEVKGNIDSGGSVDVNGNVGGCIDSGGSVTISGNVGGYVDAGGSVNARDVNGYIDAGGSVICNSHK